MHVYLSVYMHSMYFIFTNWWTCTNHVLSFRPPEVQMDSFACLSSPLDAQLLIGLNGLKRDAGIWIGFAQEQGIETSRYYPDSTWNLDWRKHQQKKKLRFSQKEGVVCSWCTRCCFLSIFLCLLCMKDFATEFMMLFVSSPRICQTLMDEDTVPLAPAVVQVGKWWWKMITKGIKPSLKLT